MFALAGGELGDANLWNVSLGRLVLSPRTGPRNLRIERLASRSDLMLPINRDFGPRDLLHLASISCPTLHLASPPAEGGIKSSLNAEYRPKSIDIADIRCARIDVGEQPDEFIAFLQGDGKGTAFGHDYNFFGQIARSYLEGAHYPLAREMYVRQKNADTEQEQKVAWWVMKALSFVEFGANLNLAVGTVALFVLAGWGLFGYGGRLDRRDRERLGRQDDGWKDPNWLWFSIDSAIPFLSLNEDHKKISFSRWWCQYYLYLMKILSPLFVFFAFQFLRQLLPA